MKPSWMLAVIMLAGLAACSDAPEGGQQRGPLPVTVAPPLVADITDWDEYTGRFEAVDAVDVKARVSGYLQSIHFTDGEIVEAGDLLFVIDPRPFELALSRAEADVRRAEARVAFTTTELDRAQNLLARGNTSRENFDLATQERNQALAELDAAKAAAGRAGLDVEFTRVVAPISGRISNYFVARGNLVVGEGANADVLTRIVSIDPIHFVFDASEAAYLKYIRLSQAGDRPSGRDVKHPVRIKLPDEDGFNHEGQLNFVDNRIDPDTGTMRGRAILENTDGVLIPGIFGRLRLKGRGPYEALLVPDSAVVAAQTQRMVMVVGPEGRVMPKLVELGPLHRGLRIIRSGLAKDDQIILDGLMMARPGAPVAPNEGAIAFAE